MKPSLFLLPIEPLEERYTGAWWKWLPESFSDAFDVVVVQGLPLTDTVETGAFLDLHSRVHWCAVQVQRMAQAFKLGKVRDGDAIFIADLEHWGVEALRYMARLSGVRCYIFGFLHAASYTVGDFMAPMQDVGMHAELAWIASCDLVFVGSPYHEEAVCSRRLIGCPSLAARIIVTGNPWRTEEARALVDLRPERDIDILYPHRPDAEKRPGVFLRYLDAYASKHGMPRVAFTTGRPEYRSTNAPDVLAAIHDLAERYPDHVTIHTGLVRAAFYRMLARSKVVVSTSLEENFGYAMVEAMAQEALPLMPACASHPYLARNNAAFLVGSDESFEDKLAALLDLEGEALREAQAEALACAQRFDSAEANIVRAMQDTMQEAT